MAAVLQYLRCLPVLVQPQIACGESAWWKGVYSHAFASAKLSQRCFLELRLAAAAGVQKAEKLGTGPIILGFFLFVIVGSGESCLAAFIYSCSIHSILSKPNALGLVSKRSHEGPIMS